MPSHDDLTLAPVSARDRWGQQWAQVPGLWRRPVYRIDHPDAARVFVINEFYLKQNRAGTEHDFTPPGAPPRFADELAWWVWVCATEGTRKVNLPQLRACSTALGAAAAEYQRHHHRPPVSIADLSVETIVRHALVRFEQRNGRLPAAGTRRNIVAVISHMHRYVTVRCTDTPWWGYDVWDLVADPRIPQREHEPQHDQTINLAAIEPVWLREGMRFWLRISLDAQLLRWTSALSRPRDVGRHLGGFLTARGVTDPLVATDPTRLRQVFIDFTEYLRSPAARAKHDVPVSETAIDGIQANVQAFYTFMVDHAPEAAAATGERRWADITVTHTRLWGPAFRARRGNRYRELTWYSTAELQQMLAYLDVMAADRDTQVTITHPDGTISDVCGLGDPSAARVWLLQALTGRRASEILMLDYHPLQAIPGADRPTDGADPSVFVAKLRYQQTKVDGVDPTILVEQAVVNIIAEQQQWMTATYPGLVSKYLFVGRRHQHNGQRHRPYTTYRDTLGKLDNIHGLTDAAGNPLRFSQTHRLRHTRATELLNDGVPIHVVQRYLGHKSPEMTMRYAATLSATAETEFLRHKKIGAHGTEIAISPTDIYTMTQLGSRTDRVLPNGVCLLPPLKTCDKGNACLSCGHFATDATHLDELREQRARTQSLLDTRRSQHLARTGRELTDDNIWVHERLRELSSLAAIIDRISTEHAVNAAIAGAGTAHRIPLTPVATRGAHDSALRKADPAGSS